MRYVVVGAGFTGATIAERIACMMREEVLVIDRQRFVGGAAHDDNDGGIVVQSHGPHVFHTNSDKVWEYVRKFGRWRDYEYHVAASVDQQLIRLPFDASGIEQVFLRHSRTILLAMERHYGKGASVPVAEVKKTFPDVGSFVYEKIFRGYSEKHWGMPLEELPASVTARMPIVVGRQKSFFTDKHQAIPVGGYTAIITRMLAHPRIKLSLGTDFKDLKLPEGTKIIFTGSPDEFFGEGGALPYRTVRFEVERVQGWRAAPYATVTHPSPNVACTRVTNTAMITGGASSSGAVTVTDYPSAHVYGETEPYYPIHLTKNVLAAEAYQRRAPAGVYFIGRLGSYRYLNMDQAVAQALALFEKLRVSVN